MDELGARMTAYQAGSLAAFEALAAPLLAYLTALTRDQGKAQDAV